MLSSAWYEGNDRITVATHTSLRKWLEPDSKRMRHLSSVKCGSQEVAEPHHKLTMGLAETSPKTNFIVLDRSRRPMRHGALTAEKARKKRRQSLNRDAGPTKTRTLTQVLHMYAMRYAALVLQLQCKLYFSLAL